MEIANPHSKKPRAVGRPRYQADEGYGARSSGYLFNPAGAERAASVSRRGGTELADKTHRSRFPLARRGAFQAHEQLIAGWVGMRF